MIDYRLILAIAKQAAPDTDVEAFRLAWLQDRDSLTPGEQLEVKYLLARHYRK